MNPEHAQGLYKLKPDKVPAWRVGGWVGITPAPHYTDVAPSQAGSEALALGQQSH